MSDVPLLALVGTEARSDESDRLSDSTKVANVNRHRVAGALSRRSRLIRLAIFLLLEIAYIALAIACYRKPILLPSFFTSSNHKGILTVAFIAWQTIAILPVDEMTIFVFSGEWSVQLSRTGQLVPGVTDGVSTLTANVLDRIFHFFARETSGSFKSALIVWIAFISLRPIAPGTFTTTTVNQTVPIQLQIANLTFDAGFDSLLFPVQRPALITRLEQVEKSRFGYDVQPNWIVGWPSLDLPGVGGTVQYRSDGVMFQYACTWEAPVVTYRNGMIYTFATIGNVWHFWPFGGDDAPNPFPYSALLLPLTNKTNGLSAYLFLGSNTTLKRVSEIDLSGIPATYNASGYRWGTTNISDPTVYAPPLASVLVCDPQMNVSSVTVARETNLSLHILSSNPSAPRVGNIPEDTASLIFSLALLAATSPSQPFVYGSILLNFLAASLFMSDPTLSSDTWSGEARPLGTRPLSLSTINANMDRYVLSASKAYAGGYLRSYGTGAGFATLPVGGMVQVPRLALTVSKLLLIVTAVGVGVTALLLAALALGREGGQPFTLGSVIEEVQGRPQEFQVMVEPKRRALGLELDDPPGPRSLA